MEVTTVKNAEESMVILQRGGSEALVGEADKRCTVEDQYEDGT